MSVKLSPCSSLLESDRNSVSVSVMALKLAIFLVLVTAVIVKHGFSLLLVMAKSIKGQNYPC